MYRGDMVEPERLRQDKSNASFHSIRYINSRLLITEDLSFGTYLASASAIPPLYAVCAGGPSFYNLRMSIVSAVAMSLRISRSHLRLLSSLSAD